MHPTASSGRCRGLLRTAYHAIYRTLVPIRWWLADRFEKQPAPPGLCLPRAKLRFRVGESVDATEFLRLGKQTADNIEKALGDSGNRVSDFRNILDFGCGCGRTLMWLRQRYSQVKWHGSDVDEESIQWCHTNIPGAIFTANAEMPPLPYKDATFDFLYAISVFTHLDGEHQQAWISEFQRVLRPGGLLLLTIHSEQVWKSLDSSEEVASRNCCAQVREIEGHYAELVPNDVSDTGSPSEVLLSELHHPSIRRDGMGQDAIVARRN